MCPAASADTPSTTELPCVKCIKCQTDNKLKERTANGGKCKSCGHPFVFDPKAESGTKMDFTDPFFLSVVKVATAQDTLQVTERQLFYAFCERYAKRKNPLASFGCFTLVLCALTIILSFKFSAWLFIFAFLLSFVGGLLLIPSVSRRWLPQKPQPLALDHAHFAEWLQRWLRTNGKIKKLLPPPPTTQPPAQTSTEIAQYSFDRAVVCQHDDIAQFLIANNFHFEHNCAVLSWHGYPQSIFGTVMLMLRRNPALKVYVLHDASAEGVQLTQQLLNNELWFKNFPNVRVYDLGLMPRQVMKRRVLLSPQTDTPKQRKVTNAGLLPDEIEWLKQGFVVELAAVRPQKLLQMVALGIAKSRDPNATDTFMVLDDGPHGLYVYSSDSFG
jgi:hypothetical protein